MMGFVGDEGLNWNNYCQSLKRSHVRIKEEDEDIIV